MRRQVPPGQRDRLRALGRLADMVRDADLARLAAASARLNDAVARRDTLDAALADAGRYAAEQAELVLFQTLQAHLTQAECTRGRLDDDIARAAAAHWAERDRAALSAGRAEVLAKLAARR